MGRPHRSIGNIDVVRASRMQRLYVRHEMTIAAARLRKAEQKYVELADRARLNGSPRLEGYLMLAHACAQAAHRFEVDIAMLKT